MVRTIADSEKFKKDAYFLCGANTGTPNQPLIDACEAYLEVCETGGGSVRTAENLIAQLEKAAASTPDVLGKNRVSDNLSYIRQLLEEREEIIGIIQ